MRNFLLRIQAAWRCAATFSYVEEANTDGLWNEDDARATEHFFSSLTGKKLGIRLRNYMIQSAIAAVGDPNTTQHKIGKAAGVAEAIVFIEGHYPQRQVQSEPETLDAMEAQAI